MRSDSSELRALVYGQNPNRELERASVLFSGGPWKGEFMLIVYVFLCVRDKCEQRSQNKVCPCLCVLRCDQQH